MTSTYSVSTTFTRTHASYLASKVAADLRQMQRFYGKPSDGEIDDYVEELIQLLLGGYLKSIDYGFRKDGKWVVALSYTAYAGGLITTDDNSGRVPLGADVSGATWWSYLRKSDSFFALGDAQRSAIEESLPINRTSAAELQGGNGMWVTDKAYSSNGTAIQRRTFKPLT